MNRPNDGEVVASLGGTSKSSQPRRHRDPLADGAVKPSVKNQSKPAENSVNENYFDLSSVSSSTSAPGTIVEDGMANKTVPAATPKAAPSSLVAENGGNLHRHPSIDGAVTTPLNVSMGQNGSLVKENIPSLQAMSPMDVQNPSYPLAPFSSASSPSFVPPKTLPLPTPANSAALTSPAPAQFLNSPSISPKFASPKAQQTPTAVVQPRRNEGIATMNAYRYPVPTTSQEKSGEAIVMEDGEDDDEESGWLRYLFPRLDPRFAHPDLSHMPLDDQLGGLLNKVEWDITLERPPNALEKLIAKFLLAPLAHRLHFMVVIIAVVLSIVVLPISQVDVEDNACYTYWGYKTNCADVDYTYRISNLPCSSTQTLLLIGSICATIHVVIVLVLLGLSWYQIFVADFLKAVTKNAARGTSVAPPLESIVGGCSSASILTKIIIAFTSISIVVQVVSWAPIISLRYSTPCIVDPVTLVPPLMSYGPGFGISIFLFCARLASCIAAIIAFFVFL